MNEIGKALRERRLEKGLTMREVAAKAGISHTEVFRIESGERIRSSTPILLAIGEALGLSNDAVLRMAGYIADDGATALEKAFPDLRTEKERDAVRKIVDGIARRSHLQLSASVYDDMVKQMDMVLDYAEKQSNPQKTKV